jgi:hypothetical protein
MEQFSAVSSNQVTIFNAEPAPGRVEHRNINGDTIFFSIAALLGKSAAKFNDPDTMHARVTEILLQIPFGDNLPANGFDLAAFDAGTQRLETSPLRLNGYLQSRFDLLAGIAHQNYPPNGGMISFIAWSNCQ